MSFPKQFRALLRRNFLLRFRTPILTIFELVLPSLILCTAIIVQLLGKTTTHSPDLHLTDALDSTQTGGMLVMCYLLYQFDRVIAFYPEEKTTPIVNFLKSANFPDQFLIVFPTENDFNDYISHPKYGHDEDHKAIHAGVQFDDAMGPWYDYSLRFNVSTYKQYPLQVPSTLVPQNDIYNPAYKTQWLQYEYTGFTWLQNVIDAWILNKEGVYQWEGGLAGNLDNFDNDDNHDDHFDHSSQFSPTFNPILSDLNIRIKHQPMPTVGYQTDAFIGEISQGLAFLLILVYVWPILRILHLLVEEKEKKLKTAIILMGCEEPALILSHLVYYIIYFVITSALLAITATFNLFPKSNPVIIFLLFFLFGLSIFSFAYFLSAFFQLGARATIFGCIFYFATFFLTFLIQGIDDSPYWMNLIMCLVPSGSLSVSSNLILYLERRGYGAQFGLLFANVYRFDLFSGLFMLFFDFIYLMALGIWCNGIFDNNFSAKQKGIFFMFQKHFWVSFLTNFISLCFSCCSNTDFGSADRDGISLHEPFPRLDNILGRGDGVLYDTDNPVSPSEFIPYIQPPLANDVPIIQLRNVTKEFTISAPAESTSWYKSLFSCACRSKKIQTTAVNNLNLDIPNGCVLVLAGENGSGKTTTLSMIMGLLRATSGQILIAGNDPNNDAGIYHNQGVVFQHDVLYDELTVMEHMELFYDIKIGKENNDDRLSHNSSSRLAHITKLLDEVGLGKSGDDSMHLPTASLSGGQKRRLSLAMALLKNPKIIILDEPCGGIDALAQRNIWDIILKLKNQDRVILITSHDMEEIEILSDQVCIINNGVLCTQGNTLWLKNALEVGYTLNINKDLAAGGDIDGKFGGDLGDESSHSFDNQFDQKVVDSRAKSKIKTDFIPLHKRQDVYNDIIMDNNVNNDPFQHLASIYDDDRNNTPQTPIAPPAPTQTPTNTPQSLPRQTSLPTTYTGAFITKFLITKFPFVFLLDDSAGEISFRFSLKFSPFVPQLLASLEASKNRFGISTFGIGVTSLTEVYIRVVEEFERFQGSKSVGSFSGENLTGRVQDQEDFIVNGTNGVYSNHLEDDGVYKSLKNQNNNQNHNNFQTFQTFQNFENNIDFYSLKPCKNVHPFQKLYSQFCSTFYYKRLNSFKKDSKSLIWQLLYPSLLIFLGCLVLQIGVKALTELPSVKMSVGSAFPSSGHYAMGNLNKTENENIKNFYKNSYNITDWVSDPLSEWVKWPQWPRSVPEDVDVNDYIGFQLWLNDTYFLRDQQNRQRMGAIYVQDMSYFEFNKDINHDGGGFNELGEFFDQNWEKAVEKMYTNGQNDPYSSYSNLQSAIQGLQSVAIRDDVGIYCRDYIEQFKSQHVSRNFDDKNNEKFDLISIISSFKDTPDAIQQVFHNKTFLNNLSTQLLCVSHLNNIKNNAQYFPQKEKSQNFEHNFAQNLDQNDQSINSTSLPYFPSTTQYAPNSQLTATLYFNTSGTNSLPAYRNLLHNTLLTMKHPNSTINMTHRPLPQSRSQKALAGSTIAFMICIALSFIPSNFATFITQERTMGFKHLQVMSGIPKAVYWASNWVFDVVSFTPSFCCIMFFLFVFDFASLTTIDGVLVTIFGLWAFVMASCPFSYVLSFFFDSHITAQSTVLILNILSSTSLLFISMALFLNESTQDLNNSIRFLFRLLPPYCIGELFLYTMMRDMIKPMGTSAFHPDLGGWALFFLLFDTVLYGCILFLIEYCIDHSIWFRFMSLFTMESPSDRKRRRLDAKMARNRNNNNRNRTKYQDLLNKSEQNGQQFGQNLISVDVDDVDDGNNNSINSLTGLDGDNGVFQNEQTESTSWFRCCWWCSTHIEYEEDDYSILDNSGIGIDGQNGIENGTLAEKRTDSGLNNEDEDVKELKMGILRGDFDSPQEYPVVIKGLSKHFSNHVSFSTEKKTNQNENKNDQKSAQKKITIAVDNLFLKLKKNEILVLIGKNGSGKSSLLRMLVGLSRPTVVDHSDDFNISYHNNRNENPKNTHNYHTDPNSLGDALIGPQHSSLLTEPSKVAQLIGYVPQFDSLLPLLTPREHLTLFATLRFFPTIHLADNAYQDFLLESINMLQFADTPASKLSGGNRRKLQCLIAIMGTEFLVMDEISTGLSPVSRRNLWKILSSPLVLDKTVLFTTHSMEEAQGVGDNIAVLVGGKLKAYGTPLHLIQRFGNGIQVEIQCADGKVGVVLEWFFETFGKDSYFGEENGFGKNHKNQNENNFDMHSSSDDVLVQKYLKYGEECGVILVEVFRDVLKFSIVADDEINNSALFGKNVAEKSEPNSISSVFSQMEHGKTVQQIPIQTYTVGEVTLSSVFVKIMKDNLHLSNRR
jgi:ABC-type multidrug transport system ATPase subunit